MSLKYEKKNIPLAKQLRKEMTPWERRLWYCFLKAYPVRFQRQKSIDNYIADFYCAKANLVIELDGSGHYSQEEAEYDQNRSKILESYGIQVIRFSNLDIDRQFDAVCSVIDRAVTERTS